MFLVGDLYAKFSDYLILSIQHRDWNRTEKTGSRTKTFNLLRTSSKPESLYLIN